jgi:hypothetical protein
MLAERPSIPSIVVGAAGVGVGDAGANGVYAGVMVDFACTIGVFVAFS